MNVASPMEELFWQEWQAWGVERHLDPAGTDHIGELQRQYPIGRYRVDFALPALREAVEIDGFDYHSSREQLIGDRRRQREIEAAGWRVVRFAGSEVHRDAEDCVLQVMSVMFRIPPTPEIAERRRRYGADLMADLGLTEADIDRS